MYSVFFSRKTTYHAFCRSHYGSLDYLNYKKQRSWHCLIKCGVKLQVFFSINYFQILWEGIFDGLIIVCVSPSLSCFFLVLSLSGNHRKRWSTRRQRKPWKPCKNNFKYPYQNHWLQMLFIFIPTLNSTSSLEEIVLKDDL